MRILLFFSIFIAFTVAIYLEDKRFPAGSPDDDDDGEILVKNFNKCPKDQYYDLYTAACQKCTKCPKGKFAVNECKVFDNTECASCSNRELSNTRAYRANCRSLPIKSDGYHLRDGMRKAMPVDVDVHWKTIGEVRSRSKRIVQIKLQSEKLIPELHSYEATDSDNEIPDLLDSFADEDFYDDEEEDDYVYDELLETFSASSEEDDEDTDPETMDAQMILPAARPIIDEFGVLEVMSMSNDPFNSDESDISVSDSVESESTEEEPPKRFRVVKKVVDEEDSDSEELIVAQTIDEDSFEQEDVKNVNLTESLKKFKTNLLAWNLLTKFFVFVAYCFAIMALFVAFRYAQNMRKQRTFNVQPLVLTPDQHHDLLRTVNYLQSKRRGPFKYEPLEEFV